MQPNPASYLTAEDSEEQWPTPDPNLLEEGRLPPPSFPFELFLSPQAIRNGVEDLDQGLPAIIRRMADAKGCPPDYAAAAILGGAASLIGNARWASAFEGSFLQPAVLWMGLVGDPSAGKSQAIQEITKILSGIAETHQANYIDQLREYDTRVEAADIAVKTWRDQCQIAKEEGGALPTKPRECYPPQKPQQPVGFLSDVTIEAICEYIAAQPKGALMALDELASLVANFGRRGGDDRQLYLMAYGGVPHTVARVKYGGLPISIPRLSCSMLGAIQPDRLSSLLLRGDNDGFAQRFLFVWPYGRAPVWPRFVGWDNELQDAFRHLDRLKMHPDEDGSLSPGYLALTQDGNAILQEFREQIHEFCAESSGHYSQFLGKAPGTVLRLAVVLELLHWALAPDGPEPTEISIEMLSVAIELVQQYFAPMAERVFGDASLPGAERNAATLAREIKRRRPSRINACDVRRNWRLAGLRESASVDAACLELVDAGWLKHDGHRDGNSRGRTRKDFLVNPRVKEL